MTNYMKSEFYRILHGKTIYVMTLSITALAILINVVLYLCSIQTAPFRYGNIRYAFILMITSMQLFYIGALMVVMCLSSDEYRNGALKNAVAGGISRTHIFIGKCIVYGITATCSAAVILTVFISSAYALLEFDPAVPMESTQPLEVLLTGVAANLPFSLACVVLTVALCQMFKKEGYVYMAWYSIIWLIPQACQILGFKVPLLARIAQWMPWNFLRTQVSAAFDSQPMDAIWMHPEGFQKHMIAGAVGILLFGAVGLVGFRRKDIP